MIDHALAGAVAECEIRHFRRGIPVLRDPVGRGCRHVVNFRAERDGAAKAHWDGLRFDINPVIASVSVIMIIVTTIALVVQANRPTKG